MKNVFGVCVLTATLVGLTGASAEAALTVQVYDQGVLVFTCVDQDACDPGSAVGVVSPLAFLTPYFNVKDLTATSTAADSSVAADLELRSIDVRRTNNTPGGQHKAALQIRVSDNGFVNPNVTDTLLSALSVTFENGKESNDVVLEGFADDSNALFGTTTAAPAITLAIAGLSGTVSGGTNSPFTATGPYSLTSFTTIRLTKSSGDIRRRVEMLADVSVEGSNVGPVSVPEPGSLTMLGFALFGAAAAFRRFMT